MEPDPWGETEDPVFDPHIPRFADVPLVRLVDDRLVIVRGELADDLHVRVIEEIKRLLSENEDAPADGEFGVFANEFGGLSVTGVGWLIVFDMRWQHYIDVQDLMYVDTTAALAERFREFAELLQRLADAGWEYTDVDPVHEISFRLPTYPSTPQS